MRLRILAAYACALFSACLALSAHAQEADREWIPFDNPEETAVQSSHVVAKAKSSGGMTIGATSFSGTGKNPWDEYDKQVQGSGVIGSLGPDLFGDTVEYYKNTLSFSVTDISLPGNFPLPVALTRKMAVVDRYAFDGGMGGYDQPLQDWNLDIPNISGVYAPAWTNARCSSYALPQPPTGSGGYTTRDFWHGLNANMPGGGEMLVPNVDNTNTSNNEAAPRPANGDTHRWMTAGFTYFRCTTDAPASGSIPAVDAVGNADGEGFEAITTDGTRYTFGWMALNDQPESRRPTLTNSAGDQSGYAPLVRKLNSLYITKVKDRFGNTVTYTYDNLASEPVRLKSISASDGRLITLNYPEGSGTLSSATAHGRTWTYQYAAGSLSAVILPDNTRWTYDFAGLAFAIIEPDLDPATPRSCNNNNFWVGGGGAGKVTHPSGAIGIFTVTPMRHGRSNVPKYCDNWAYSNNETNDDVSVVPRAYDVLSIRKKEISGPGIVPFEWEYTGGSLSSWASTASAQGYVPVCQTQNCMEPVCVSDDCSGSHVTSIIGREVVSPTEKVVRNFQRVTFGNSYRYNEGKLLSVERGANSSPSGILEKENYTYELAQSGQNFATPIAKSLQDRSAGFTSEFVRPLKSKVITRDGVDFAWTVRNVVGFDAYARTTKVDRSSLIKDTGPVLNTKYEETLYRDRETAWVVGLVEKVTVDGIEASRIDFDANHRPQNVYSFGLRQKTLGYDDTAGINGTLSTVTDGNLKTTMFSDWHRGVPRSMKLADTAGTTLSAVVDDLGQVTQFTDEMGVVTNFGYDSMGRLWLTDYTNADTVQWNSTIRTFGTMGAGELGIPSGSWKSTVSTGNGRTTSWYNGRWQPVLMMTEDTTNAATRSYVETRYDALGRAVFRSYPVPTFVGINLISNGITTDFDALGRVTQVKQHFESEELSTRMAYLAPFKMQVTNPRDIISTTEYQAFDSPNTDSPVKLVAAVGTAEQQTTELYRDRFGKPLTVELQ